MRLDTGRQSRIGHGFRQTVRPGTGMEGRGKRPPSTSLEIWDNHRASRQGLSFHLIRAFGWLGAEDLRPEVVQFESGSLDDGIMGVVVGTIIAPSESLHPSRELIRFGLQVSMIRSRATFKSTAMPCTKKKDEGGNGERNMDNSRRSRKVEW